MSLVKREMSLVTPLNAPGGPQNRPQIDRTPLASRVTMKFRCSAKFTVTFRSDYVPAEHNRNAHNGAESEKNELLLLLSTLLQ